MIIWRKHSPILDCGTMAVNVNEYNASIEDSDEYIESVVEQGRYEYYEAWMEYVREYD